MNRILFTCILALMVTCITAIPVASLHKRSFKVRRVELPNYVPNGKAAMKRAFLKFGVGDAVFKPNGEAATNIRNAATIYANAGNRSMPGTEDGGVATQATQNDAQFLAPVKVGGQELILNFDSGSADMWVFNSNLPPQDRIGHTFYNPKKSAKSKASPNMFFKIQYGDGSATKGPVGFDEVDIGGSTVAQQAVGIPNYVSDSFIADTASNGLVGLAFSKINTISTVTGQKVTPAPQKTFFDNIVSDLSLPVFTAQLKGGTVGSYEFGRIDDTAYTGELAQVPIDSSGGFWEFESTKAVIGSNTTVSIPGGRAIADTGTSLMLVQEELFYAYWNQTEGAKIDDDGQAIFPCNADLPDLQLAAGPSYMATVPGPFMNYSRTGTPGYCHGGLQSIGQLGIPFAILGDVWFKSQFVVFQATGPSLGIAPHA